GQQQILVRLEVDGARARRAGDEFDGLWRLGIAHIDDGNTVAEAVADVGEAAVHHDLDAVGAAAEVRMADERDVARGDGGHGCFSLACSRPSFTIEYETFSSALQQPRRAAHGSAVPAANRYGGARSRATTRCAGPRQPMARMQRGRTRVRAPRAAGRGPKLGAMVAGARMGHAASPPWQNRRGGAAPDAPGRARSGPPRRFAMLPPRWQPFSCRANFLHGCATNARMADHGFSRYRLTGSRPAAE